MNFLILIIYSDGGNHCSYLMDGTATEWLSRKAHLFRIPRTLNYPICSPNHHPSLCPLHVY